MKWFFRYWFVVALQITIILALSSQPSNNLPELDIPNIDKLVHFGMYFLLAFFFGRALTGATRIPIGRCVIYSLLFSLLYGAFDEYYQSFIPSRDPNFLDWIADSLGAFCGSLLIVFYRHHISKIIPEK